MFTATYPAWYDNVRHDDHRTRVWRATLGLTDEPPVVTTSQRPAVGTILYSG
jgi:hypothetical protein